MIKNKKLLTILLLLFSPYQVYSEEQKTCDVECEKLYKERIKAINEDINKLLKNKYIAEKNNPRIKKKNFFLLYLASQTSLDKNMDLAGIISSFAQKDDKISIIGASYHRILPRPLKKTYLYPFVGADFQFNTRFNQYEDNSRKRSKEDGQEITSSIEILKLNTMWGLQKKINNSFTIAGYSMIGFIVFDNKYESQIVKGNMSTYYNIGLGVNINYSRLLFGAEINYNSMYRANLLTKIGVLF